MSRRTGLLAIALLALSVAVAQAQGGPGRRGPGAGFAGRGPGFGGGGPALQRKCQPGLTFDKCYDNCFKLLGGADTHDRNHCSESCSRRVTECSS